MPPFPENLMGFLGWALSHTILPAKLRTKISSITFRTNAFKVTPCCDDWWFGKGCSTSSTRAHLFAGHTTQNERRCGCLDGLDRVNCPFHLALVEKIHHSRCKHPHYSSRRHGCNSIFVYYIRPRELVGFSKFRRNTRNHKVLNPS